MSFELRGADGVEKVQIFGNNGDKLLDNVTLTQEWKQFSYLAVRTVRINFEIDNGDVHLREASNFVITLEKRWKEWSCGTPKEHGFCSAVRGGQLFFQGDYLVSLKGGTYYLHESGIQVSYMLVLTL